MPVVSQFERGNFIELKSTAKFHLGKLLFTHSGILFRLEKGFISCRETYIKNIQVLML